MFAMPPSCEHTFCKKKVGKIFALMELDRDVSTVDDLIIVYHSSVYRVCIERFAAIDSERDSPALFPDPASLSFPGWLRPSRLD